MSAPAQGTVGDSPAEYTVTVKSAGVLTVAVQGTSDLVLQVVDEDGQQVPDGSADRDLDGNPGSELLSVILGQPGDYRVRVRSNDRGTFQIAGSFLSFPPLERPADPDGRPRSARPAEVGKAVEDSLDTSAGDMWDWWVFKVAEAGTLTVVTRSVGSDDVPDLLLEAFVDGDFATAADRSDQDLQGNSANESVTLQVTAGQSVHVRVSSAFGRVAAKYQLSSSLAP